MDDLEDGELPSSPEVEEPEGGKDDDVVGEPSAHPTYVPLPRPEASTSSTTRPRSATNSSMLANAGDLDGRDRDAGFRSGAAVQALPAASGASHLSSGEEEDSTDSDDTDSDAAGVGGGVRSGKKKRRKLPPPPRPMRQGGSGRSSQDHGHAFSAMAKDFQDQRRRNAGGANNVWGSILQEDALNSDLSSIGVGRKSLKDLASDRGAETYDYTIKAEQDKALEEAEKAKAKVDLDDDLEKYWNKEGAENDDAGDELAAVNSSGANAADGMETECAVAANDSSSATSRQDHDAIRAGVKRSVKDRLGSRKHGGKKDSHHLEEFENLSIPQPGVPREIPDISRDFLQSLTRNETAAAKKSNEKRKDDEEDEEGCVSDDDVTDSDDVDDVTVLGEELANRLCEPKTELIVGVVELVGPEVALELFRKVRHIESEGGMMIKNNARRRTPGGVFLHLLREMGSNPNDSRVEGQAVKAFFAQTNQQQQQQQNRRNHRGPRWQQSRPPNSSDDFMGELEQFKKLNKKEKDKQAKVQARKAKKAAASSRDCEMEGEEDLKPLPDILSCISKQMVRDGRNSTDDASTSGSGANRASSRRSGVNAFEEEASTPTTAPPPDAPPNSVERSVSAYDDDFLSTNADTEDIELF